MNSPRRRKVLLAATAATAWLAGCSVLETDRVDYKSAGRGVSLEVPPDLTQLPEGSRYMVDRDAVSANVYEAERQAAESRGDNTAPNQLSDVQYMQDGQLRWLHVERPADKLWNQIRDFWLENGFLLSQDQPQVGVMETDWAENRAKIPQDIIRRTIGKVFDSLYSTGERDRFRTRVEQSPSGGTNIYIAHKGMEEVYASQRKDTTVWQPRPVDHGLEAEFLRRLMVKLGVSEERARAMEAAAENQAARTTVPGARILDEGGNPVIALDGDFDHAWRRTSLALDRAGFTVKDRDRSQGLFFVDYVDPGLQQTEPGLFSRIFGRGSKPLPVKEYQVRVAQDGSQSIVRVTDNEGARLVGKDAQHIIQVLAAELQ